MLYSRNYYKTQESELPKKHKKDKKTFTTKVLWGKLTVYILRCFLTPVDCIDLRFTMKYAIKDMSCNQAWEYLSKTPGSYLIDVRTQGEHDVVGVPDLTVIDKNTVFIPWVRDFTSGINPKFLSELEKYVPNKEDAVLFICKSGGRSAAAAEYACLVGYRNSINVNDGFEGNGTSGGWKMNLAYKVKHD